jgi:hypothetical protein
MPPPSNAAAAARASSHRTAASYQGMILARLERRLPLCWEEQRQQFC